MKPRKVELNPQEYEFTFESVDQGDGNLPIIFVSVPTGGHWCVTENEAKHIGNFFLAHAKYVREQLKKTPKE